MVCVTALPYKKFNQFLPMLVQVSSASIAITSRPKIGLPVTCKQVIMYDAFKNIYDILTKADNYYHGNSE